MKTKDINSINTKTHKITQVRSSDPSTHVARLRHLKESQARTHAGPDLSEGKQQGNVGNSQGEEVQWWVVVMGQVV